jgi:hypothetical protein
MVSLDLHLT